MDIFYLNIDKTEVETKREREYRAGRYLVEYAAKNFYSIGNSEIEVINNKPKFKYSNIHFSISHSYNIASVCFDKYPVGFDIELIKNRNWKPIAKRMNFNIKENSIEEFYKCWTKYEAEFKLQKKPENIISLIPKDNAFNGKYAISIASCNIHKITPIFHSLN
mgnify:CR=1 FL=1